MDALSYHLLVSLLFVFGTMIEFAVVLVVKQKLELEKDKSKDRPDGLKFETTAPKNKTRPDINVVKADLIEGMEDDSTNGRDGGRRQGDLKTKKLGLFKASSLTNKIDFAAFVVFIFGYFIFNCFYWVHYN